MSETLVLDACYVPIDRVNWKRAITLIFMGKCEVVQEYEDREIRSVTFSIKMPSIIRFLKAMRSKKKIVKFSRENIYLRDHGKCQYCGSDVPRPASTYDHVVPRAQGGVTSWDNIVIACMPCNQKKGCRTPAQAKMKLLSVPVRPKKLPNHMHVTIQWDPSMPLAWRDILTSITYWNTALEES